MKMKRVVSLVLAMTLIASTWINVSAAETTIQVTIDGELVVFTDAQPFVDSNNRTLVPLRAIGEAMGLEVEWDAELKTAAFARVYDPTLEAAPYDADEDGNPEAYLLSEIVAFEIDNSQAAFGAHWMGVEEDDADPYAVVEYDIAMDTEAVILNARTYAPVRYLAEAFNYDVSWDQATQTVALSTMKNTAEENIFVVSMFEEAIQSWLLLGNEDTKATSFEILSGKVNGVELDKTLISEDEFVSIEEELEASEISGDVLMGFEAANNISDLASYRLSLKIKAMIDDEYEIFEWEHYGVQQK